MSAESLPPLEVRGFHFYEEGRKWIAKGLTYGPFRPGRDGAQFPPVEQMERDMKAMASIGANCVRVYTTPTSDLADTAQRHGLRILADVPWPKHLDVYDDKAQEAMAFQILEEALDQTAGIPNLMGLLLGNEIPPDLVRWAGPTRVSRFLERMYLRAKDRRPDLPIGFANYPSTEYLAPSFFDFMGFNVYLVDRSALRSYLIRLRNLLLDMPVILTETGEDSLGGGQDSQSERVAASLEEAYDAGFAGAFVFSWTDEWHTGGYDINDWAFGLVDADRRAKPALSEVRRIFETAPQSKPLEMVPMVSVVVASYNGGTTLRQCLQSLRGLQYSSFEVIVVDDGSTDDTQQILADFPEVKTVRQENKGLSHARNEGIRLAQGEIVAFTDSDCEADADWLHHLMRPLQDPQCAGCGGPNLPPLATNPVHRAVALAPGHATHVLLDGELAEHVPGCNMAFRREKLLEVNGFDPLFRQAGDDVDVIWRLQDQGYTIAFCPGAFVWHHRRSTIKAYWKQQAGYGRAEALLVQRHPHRFNDRGQSIWRGTIYTDTESEPVLGRANVHYGVFAASGYQCIYARRQGVIEHFAGSLEWWLLCSALLLAGWISMAALLAGLLGALLSLMVSGLRAWRKMDRKRTLSRHYFPLVWLLWISQPIIRGGSRFLARARNRRPDQEFAQLLDGLDRGKRSRLLGSSLREYWAEDGTDRLEFLREATSRMKELHWIHAPNSGWEAHDVSVSVTWAHRVLVTTMAEEHGGGKYLLKVRLRLAATSMFWLVLAAALLGCGLLAIYDTVAARLVFLGFVLLGWYYYRLAMLRRAGIAIWLDGVATETGYDRIDSNRKLSHTAQETGGDRGTPATPRSLDAGQTLREEPK